MQTRENLKKEIDYLPDHIIEKLYEFILFQKFNILNNQNDKAIFIDLLMASTSSTEFWNNSDDEVWDSV